MNAIRRAAGAAFVAFALALPCAAGADGPAPQRTSHALGASDDLGALLFPARARRAGTERRRLAEDDRRPAPPADRSARLRAWLETYGQVVVNER